MDAERPPVCSDCRSKGSGVMPRQVGTSHIRLCADCADLRRGIQGQTRASVPINLGGGK